MAVTADYSKEKGEEEHILSLPNNRQLAYARNGPATSRTVVIFFVGIMSTGRASDVPEPARKLNAHWISPTLAGMGNSSIREDLGEPYNVALARDMSMLLKHLYPTGDFDTLYVAGGSYGTVPAQMLYGAPYDLFPAGRKIKGCLLLAGFSPHKYHVDHAKNLSWGSWISVGPPSQMVPFHGVQRLFKAGIGSKFNSVEGAVDFLRKTLFNKMGDWERGKFEEWLEKKNTTETEFTTAMAKSAMLCCKRWDGFFEVSDVIHSDWGFNPSQLDDQHASKPVLIVESEDDSIGGGTTKWLVDNYQSASLKVIRGGHISCLFYMDEIWEQMIAATKY